MPTFCWKCQECGATAQTDRPLAPSTVHQDIDGEVCGSIVRDYKAEAVGVSLANLRESR